nr:MAG TPA: hypothetical protein [Caudoviricetes sp.]
MQSLFFEKILAFCEIALDNALILAYNKTINKRGH